MCLSKSSTWQLFTLFLVDFDRLNTLEYLQILRDVENAIMNSPVSVSMCLLYTYRRPV